MAGVGVSVLAEDVLAKLKGMQDRGGNLKPAMQSFGGYMLRSIQANFDAEGRPEHWQPLSMGTLLAFAGSRKSFKTKAGRMSGHGARAMMGRLILTNTGRLRRSITAEPGANSLAVGTNVVYAAIHQFGGMAGRGRKVRIPARPYLVFQETDVAWAVKIIGDYVVGEGG
jgi:phage virion morphogenesis protein